MNILRLSRNVTIIALLLSLLFHVSTVLYVFMQKKSHIFNDADQLTEQQKESEKMRQQKDWAETKARASNFGAPVFFEDAPSYAEASEGRPEEDDKEQSLEQTDTAELQEITEPEELPEEENSPQENIIEKSIAPEAALQEIVRAVPIESTLLRPLILSLSKDEGQVKKNPRKKRTRTKKASSQQNQYVSAPSTPKPPLSLAQLTQGFMHHLKDEGKYAVSMLGNKSGRPTQEQLKYERYLQKLGWCLQNAYNINSDRCPAIPQDTTTHVNLILNRDGTTRHLAVSKSSKNLHLDAFTLFIFREASSSFPPVPDYLKVDPFAITYVITVGASDGKNMRFYQR